MGSQAMAKRYSPGGRESSSIPTGSDHRKRVPYCGCIANVIALLVQVCGQMPLCEMTEFRAKSPSSMIVLDADYKTLVEYLQPRVLLHTVAYIGLIHVGFDHGQT